MLTALATGLRFRIAFLLAIFAALCFVAPPAVLAFGHGSATAHCMARADQLNHGNVTANDTADHGGHSSPAGNHKMSCCGLFCLSALAADIGAPFTPIPAHARPVPVGDEGVLSPVPGRLDRPPIFPSIL